MNVYDFDKTIYRKDSGIMFYLWCLRRHPRIARRWPYMLWATVRYQTGRIDAARHREAMFSYLNDLKDAPDEVERFWQAQIGQVHGWYLRQRNEDDVIVSASPRFLVEPAARRLGVQGVLASPMDIATGRYTGPRCHGAGKVNYFRETFPGAEVDAFYSDSLKDSPMAALAKRAYLVRGESLAGWPEMTEEKKGSRV